MGFSVMMQGKELFAIASTPSTHTGTPTPVEPVLASWVEEAEAVVDLILPLSPYRNWFDNYYLLGWMFLCISTRVLTRRLRLNVSPLYVYDYCIVRMPLFWAMADRSG
jgi:hypothetical protein